MRKLRHGARKQLSQNHTATPELCSKPYNLMPWKLPRMLESQLRATNSSDDEHGRNTNHVRSPVGFGTPHWTGIGFLNT